MSTDLPSLLAQTSPSASPISEQASHLWTLESALEVIRPLEKLVSGYFGGHIALAGSVLYRGWSDNDLDLHIYAHANMQLNLDGIFGGLIACGWAKPERLGKLGSRYPEQREIYKTTHQGRLVNVFISRLELP